MTLPFTAWEQAAIVGIFAVFVIAMMGWVYKLVRDSQNHNDDQALKYQVFVVNLQDKFNEAMGVRTEQWQATILQRDKDWQKYMDLSRQRDTDALCNVADSVKSMAVSVDRMTERLEEHDRSLEPRVQSIINAEVARANGTKKRTRADSSV
jgi:hypothetical protein